MSLASQRDGEPVKVTVTFNPLSYKLLELVAEYENKETVEEWIMQAIAELVGAWGEGIERDEWREYFAPAAEPEKKEEA